jgi:hypothetical protein
VADLSVADALFATRACSCGGDGDDNGSSASESDISMTSAAAALVFTRALAGGDDGSSASESDISMISFLSDFSVSSEEAIVDAVGCSGVERQTVPERMYVSVVHAV